MFYHIQILAKKGPLGTIWIAAHHDRRLKRSQVFETSILKSVDSIMSPEIPLALRLSGQLMLGIVRIYAKKVGYLFQDCNDSFGRMKSVSRTEAGVDLPTEAVNAPVHMITMAELEEDPDYVMNLPFSGSVPSTPISLGAESPEVPRRGSITSELRRSLSFESPRASFSMDLDMEERFEAADGDVFDVEPEKLRSEAVETTPLGPADPGRASFDASTPGGPDLAPVEIEPFVQDEDLGAFATPGSVPGGDPRASGEAKARQARKKPRLTRDVSAATGEKKIVLENKYVRERLHDASDTMRDLEGDAARAARAPWEGPRAGRRQLEGACHLPATSVVFCSDLAALFAKREQVRAEAEEDMSDQEAFEPMPDFDDAGGFGMDAVSPFDEAAPAPAMPGQEAGAEGEDAYVDDDALEADKGGYSARTKQALEQVKAKLTGGGATPECSFTDVLPHKTKRDASRLFFEMLVLNSKGYIDLDQGSAFSPLRIRPRELLSQS